MSFTPLKTTIKKPTQKTETQEPFGALTTLRLCCGATKPEVKQKMQTRQHETLVMLSLMPLAKIVYCKEYKY